MYRVILGLLLISGLLPGHLLAQNIPVPFRYPDGAGITAVTLPGTFNGWQTSGPSTMQRIDSLGQWMRQQTLALGQTVQYKFLVTTASGSAWTTDPNNPDTNPADNNNSVLTVRDPAVFQPILRTEQGLVTHFTAGIITSGALQSLTLSVAGGPAEDVLAWYDPVSRVMQVSLSEPVVEGTRFELQVVSAAGEASATVGSLVSPLALTTPSRRTTEASFRLRGVATSASGAVDPSLTAVTLLRDGAPDGTLPVVNGQVDADVSLQMGANRLSIAAVIDGVSLTSNEVTLTRWSGPMEDRWFDIRISGSGFAWQVDIDERIASPGISSVGFTLDEGFSTVSSTFSEGGRVVAGTAAGPGDVFIDIEARSADGRTDRARAAVRILPDGAAVAYAWAEKAAWIDQAVVYEIFPLAFGPVEASGSVGAEGNRFNEIADALPYIRDMGFNTIWFMPIMQNLDMSGLGGGYSVIDFRRVDPKLGTNEDFRALVDRAHDLGLRIILDLTINHASQDHPWVRSLTGDGNWPGFVQTVPSPHNQGRDNRGASLPEKSSDNGAYRVYDGFGQLANLNWDNDDLQVEMLDVVAYWLTEFDVDGFRFDAYWGPWRRYGPERFGWPVRELMRRLKPDALALGEIEGVGPGTEVYYADDANGTQLPGGLDSAYDWTFSAYIRNPVYYANMSGYAERMTNYGFVPGPNARWFRFLENHDETRIQELYKTQPDRVRPLTGMLMTAPGIPMLFQGQEVGYGAGSGDRRRLPVNWSTSRNREWAGFHRFLAMARERFEAFGTQDVSFLRAPTGAMAYVRPLTDENALVLINFAGSSQSFVVDPSAAAPMSTDGPIPWFDLAADTSGAYLGGFRVTLDPYEVVVYISSSEASLGLGPLPDLPFGAIYTGVEAGPLPAEMALQAPWPNPASGPVQMEWTQRAGPSSIRIYDVLGRQVLRVHDGVRTGGVHLESIDVSGWAPGMYWIRLQAPGRTETRSLVVLR
jgi:glycosidase